MPLPSPRLSIKTVRSPSLASKQNHRSPVYADIYPIDEEEGIYPYLS